MKKPKPASPRKDRVPAEYVGLARQFRQAVTKDFESSRESLLQLMIPVMRRLERKPTLRPSKEIDLIREWRDLPSPHRLRFEQSRDQANCLVVDEIKCDAVELQFPQWQSWEAGVSLSRLRLTTNGRMKFEALPIVIVSLHALARWMQRSGRRRDHPTLMAHLYPLLDAPDDEDEVHAGIGTWLSDARMLMSGNNRRLIVRAVRTFIVRQSGEVHDIREAVHATI